MNITLDEMKNYLRVDTSEDDILISSLLVSAKSICLSVARIDDEKDITDKDNFKVAILYTVAYLYEHREEANHKDLMLTLRSLLFGMRKAEF
ncbi:head-tail connector protein [Ligilactobacillus ceti]|uniref:head-tail connector protein n=1 Tax=Ligilactobacillus ceti TaxID=395085 RepID=UPI000489FB86|nr:head-tail connector protein [Ligilactobacillus ceti]